MGRYLAIFSDNYNGEFDVSGFRTMTEKEVNKFEELATSITWEFSYYADKDYLYYTSGEDFLTRIEYKEITKEQYDLIEKTLKGEFGFFIGLEYLEHEVKEQMDEIEEDEESEEEDEKESDDY